MEVMNKKHLIKDRADCIRYFALLQLVFINEQIVETECSHVAPVVYEATAFVLNTLLY